MNNRLKNILLFSTASLLFFVVLFATPQKTSAVAASDWRAGNIVNDTLFTDGNGMSVQQIQTFLEQRLPFCDKSGSQASELGGGTRAQYGASVGNPAPFTCITNYYEVPKTTPGAYIPQNNYGQYNANGSTYIPPGAKSAAQLIYDAAQKYNINPKVLLIKLATESAGPLTSDPWPLKKQYFYAMGAHCPDSGPGGSANCDINYSGFSMQIAESAELLRGYLDGMSQGWWPYKKPFQTNSIMWNVAPSGCGAGNVYIETKATAALYTYTPYQPNTSALNNMYGTGDSCSAYGNRNFWRVWTDWFGSTQEAGYTPFFQIPGSVTTYMLGAGNTYYRIDDYERLKHYGFESVFKLRVKSISQSSLSGYVFKGVLPEIARFEGIGVFLLQDGKMHPFPSEEILASYGYSFGQEALLPKEVADILPQGSPLWRVVGENDGKTTYYMSNGKKQAICNTDAFTKLGSPVYSSQPAASLRKDYLATRPNSGPIAVEGDIIEGWNGNTYGVWQNNTFTPINADIAKGTKAITCGAPNDAIDQLPKSSSAIDNLVSDSAGNKFVLNKTNKLLVNSNDTVNIGTPPEKHIPVTSELLNKLTTSKLQQVVKVEGNPTVFVIRDGKSYGIPSESDLYGLGFNFSQVQIVTQKTLSVIPYSGMIFSSGKLVREEGTLGVYLLNNNFQRHPFTSEQSFFNYGYGWNTVNTVPKNSLSAYSEGSAMGVYIREDDGNYWLMDRGVKRRVTGDLPSDSNFHLTSQPIVTLPGSFLSRFPMSTAMTKVFRADNDRGVYMIENGKKRVFASESALFSRGYNWNDVRVLSPYVVDSIPTGSPLY